MAQTPPDAMTPAPFLPFADVAAEWVDQWFAVLETVISAQRSWVKAALETTTTTGNGLVGGPMSQRLTAQTADERAPARS